MNRLLRTGKIWVGLGVFVLGIGFSSSAWAGNGSWGGSSGGYGGGSNGGHRSHRLFGGGSNGGYNSRGGWGGSNGGYYSRRGWGGSNGGYYSGGSSGGYRSNGWVPMDSKESGGTESHSTDAARKSAVLLTIVVPADAKLYIEDQPTQSTGTFRQFISPELEANKNYVYTVRADVEKNGQKISGKEELRVKAGDHATVKFTPSAENTELLVAGRK
jgi:uncharacterized protein (TIGR03000 family)